MTTASEERRACLVLWEAATCCAVPTWVFAADDGAWPVNAPLAFVVAVISGAVIAVIAFHVVPALLARYWSSHQIPSSVPLIALLPVVWYGTGAGASFLLLAHASGQTLLWTPAPTPMTWIVGAAHGTAVIAALMYASTRQQKMLAVMLIAFPITLLIVTLTGQWEGLWIRNPQLVNEHDLDNNIAVLKGIVLASAPIAIFGLSIGRDKPDSRTIFKTGVVGVCLPLIITVVLVSFAKVTAVRLYWRPSIPIGSDQALQWFVHNILPDARLPLVVMTVAPMVATAWWTREAWRYMQTWWARLILFASVLLIFSLGSESGRFAPYLTTWCWTILIGIVVTFMLRPTALRDSRSIDGRGRRTWR